MPDSSPFAQVSNYRFLIGAALAFTAAGQPLVVSRLTEPTRAIAGTVLSLSLLGFLLEYVTLAVGTRLGLVRANDPTQAALTRAVLGAASCLLVLNLFANRLSPYFLVQRSPAPVGAALAVVGAWLVFLVGVARHDLTARSCMLGLAGLVVGTRLLVLLAVPFNRLPGDMLPAIDRGLGALLGGQFPYQGLVPRMPYLPAMFLAYLPPKALGWDLRISNLVLDAALVLLAVGGWKTLVTGSQTKNPSLSVRAMSNMTSGDSSRVSDSPRPTSNLTPGATLMAGNSPNPPDPAQPPTLNLALLFFLLSPAWVYSSVNTQFAPCVLATAVLGQAVATQGLRWQALALGWALASNQMLLVLGPPLFGYWLGRAGLKSALGLTMLAMAVFLATVAPFLAWNPSQFLAETWGRPEPFSAAQMSGRFTLLPLFSGWLPHASLVLTAAILIMATLAGRRASGPASVLAVLAVSLCAALLVQPTSFPHYFLPVLVLAASVAPPHSQGTRAYQFGSGHGSQ